jgi:hypothetical protein
MFSSYVTNVPHVSENFAFIAGTDTHINVLTCLSVALTAFCWALAAFSVS